jgi:hypothetical protein
MNEPLSPADEEVVLTLPDVSMDDLIRGVDVSQFNAEQVDTQLSPSPPAPASADTRERRRANRREPHEFRAELRLAVAGFPMRLINLSASGLLAETSERLSPGRTVDVFLRYGGARKVLKATVIRSSVHAIAPNPVFRAALEFSEPLTLDRE